MSALRDILLVAGFEVRRALRTWRALALFLLYAIAYGGGTYLFIAIIGGMERTLAEQLGVAKTDVPGALLQELLGTDMFRDMILGMTGNEALLEQVTQIPPLAIFTMWFGLLLMPFFAASASAECVSLDMGSRAIRYEALRTGRLELLLGRFGGQLVLTGFASVIGCSVAFALGMTQMVGHTSFDLAFWLIWLTFRAWLFSVPFAGIGVLASTLTASAAWARVMAILGAAGSWVLFLVARGVQLSYEDGVWALAADLVLQLLPQGWMQMLWQPGVGWLPAALVCVTFGFAAVVVGYVRFATRDL